MTRVRPTRQRQDRRPLSAPAPDALPELEVSVTGLGGQGDAVARLPSGEVILIAGGVPGDRVRIARTGRSQGVQRGVLREVLEPGPARVTPPCTVADRCGGCAWQHVELGLQRQEKQALARRALGRDGVEPELAVDVPAWGFRRRVRLHLRRRPGGLQVGFMARGSDDLVATAACPVLEPALAALLPRLGPALQAWVDAGEVHATTGVEGTIAALFARPRGQAGPPPLPELAAALGVQGLTLQAGRHAGAWGLDEVTLAETATGLPVRVDAAGFCQASAAGNRAIRHAVLAALDACGPLRRAQEFFAGSGNLSALLAGRVPQVRTVESEPRAVERARRTLAAATGQGTAFEVVCGDAAEHALRPGPDELWLLDPGRPGARELCEKAARWRPAHVVYVSCALDTLARDLRELAAAGYRQTSAVLIDTFPHTPHAEMVVHLQAPPRA